ncbi:hypothetical protein HDV04_001687 [Boothiomyces sp. JEL0838]|nr:hypothetical protein HDV04_001687 [Boothiomyces sp. JEL0838]
MQGNQYGYVIAKQPVQPYPLPQHVRPPGYPIRPNTNMGYPQMMQPGYSFPPNTFSQQYPPDMGKRGMPNARLVIPPIGQLGPTNGQMYGPNGYSMGQRPVNYATQPQEFPHLYHQPSANPMNHPFHQRSTSPAPSEISQHSRNWTISSRPSTPVIIRPTMTTNERYHLHRSNSQVSVEYEPYSQAEYRKLKSRDMQMRLPRGLGHSEGEQWHIEKQKRNRMSEYSNKLKMEQNKPRRLKKIIEKPRFLV